MQADTLPTVSRLCSHRTEEQNEGGSSGIGLLVNQGIGLGCGWGGFPASTAHGRELPVLFPELPSGLP